MSRALLLRLRPRRLAGMLVTLALTLAVLTPMVLGPALGPLTQALGGAGEHVCACGMPRGTCGCPECEKVEHERLREHTPRPYPVLRGQCGGDEVVAGYATLPPSIAPATGVALLPPAREWRAAPRLAEVDSRDDAEPATPPPRRAAA